VNEARENGLLDSAEAVRITSVPGVPQSGVRLGHWLSGDESKRLLAVPDRTRLIGKRNFGILSVLVHCALRREELAHFDMSWLQKREGRWVLVDIVGKRGRRRTVDAYFSADLDETETEYRNSLVRLLAVLRPQLAELIGGPREGE
jgi:integrase